MLLMRFQYEQLRGLDRLGVVSVIRAKETQKCRKGKRLIYVIGKSSRETEASPGAKPIIRSALGVSDLVALLTVSYGIGRDLECSRGCFQS